MIESLTTRRVANGLALLVVIAVVAPFVVYAVPGVIGADYSFIVLSGSMEPEISAGDVVVVADRDPGAIAEGDVITFARGPGETPVTHRVIDVTETDDGYLYETRGDANQNPDASPVPHENVAGAVVLTIPYLGYVVQFTSTPLGFVALVVLPFGLLLATELWSLLRSNRADDGSSPDAPSPDTAETADPRAETSDEAFRVTEETIVGASLVLLALAPYAAYSAYRLRTALDVSVAIAAFTCLMLSVGLLLTVGRDASTDASGSDVAASGVSADGASEAVPGDDANTDGSGAGEEPPSTVGVEPDLSEVSGE